MTALSGAHRRAALLCALLSIALATPTAFAQSAVPATTAAEKPAFKEEFATMRDGVRLAANVFLPEGAGPWPVVLSRTPYLKDGAMSGGAARKYTASGFAYVVQDVRGKGHSQGEYRPFVDDRNDGFDTVQWAAKQSWSSGKIGMTGASALGITANLAASATPPNLVPPTLSSRRTAVSMKSRSWAAS